MQENLGPTVWLVGQDAVVCSKLTSHHTTVHIGLTKEAPGNLYFNHDMAEIRSQALRQ